MRRAIGHAERRGERVYARPARQSGSLVGQYRRDGLDHSRPDGASGGESARQAAASAALNQAASTTQWLAETPWTHGWQRSMKALCVRRVTSTCFFAAAICPVITAALEGAGFVHDELLKSSFSATVPTASPARQSTSCSLAKQLAPTIFSRHPRSRRPTIQPTSQSSLSTPSY
jgi:hypothetical protein